MSRYAVFHIDGERGLRGGERQLLYLAGWLRSRGHQNTVVCRRGGALEREARRLRLPVLCPPFLGEWDPLSAALVRRAASRAGLPALLHAHTSHAAALASLAARAGGPAWVVHRRVDFPIGSPFTRRLKYRAAGRIIAVSDAIRGILTAQGLPAERIVTVPDCLPSGPGEAALAGTGSVPGPASAAERSELRRRLGAAAGIPPEAPWIGNVAALVPHKDPSNFLRAAARLRASVPDARFLLVGDGPLRRELEAEAETLGLNGAVRFLGQQSNPWEWLRALDLFVLSSWGEGMGSVLLEAQACRVPVAATTAGGIPEVIRHGVSGLLAPPRDPDALAAAAGALLRDPARAARLAEAGAAALPRFSLSACGEKVEAVYRAVLEERAR